MKAIPALVPIALAVVAPLAAHAQVPAQGFSGKAALYSEYEYRGISQTSENPAAQLTLDYGHRSGFYAGTFVSNIKWLKDTAEENGFSTSAKLEWDIYGGFRFPIAKDVTLDAGYQRYEYPSSGAFEPKPNTDEAYVGVTWGPATVKFARTFSDAFGVPDSKGSTYAELAIDYALPAMPRVKLVGVAGRQNYSNRSDLSYSLWKAGATYDFGGGFSAGAYAKGTNAQPEGYTVKGRDWSKDRLVAFVAYSF